MGDDSRARGLDTTDRTLIALLQQDGRASFTALAKAVGLSEGAVRQRVQRLLRDDLMQIVAVTDPANVDLTRQAMVGVSVNGDPREVAERLAAPRGAARIRSGSTTSTASNSRPLVADGDTVPGTPGGPITTLVPSRPTSSSTNCAMAPSK